MFKKYDKTDNYFTNDYLLLFEFCASFWIYAKKLHSCSRIVFYLNYFVVILIQLLYQQRASVLILKLNYTFQNHWQYKSFLSCQSPRYEYFKRFISIIYIILFIFWNFKLHIEWKAFLLLCALRILNIVIHPIRIDVLYHYIL